MKRTLVFIALLLFTTSIVSGFDESLTINQSFSTDETYQLPITALDGIGLTGTYTGEGSAIVELVSENATYTLAAVDMSAMQAERTYFLGKGGIIIDLTDAGDGYTRTFNAECLETCETTVTGPLELQIRIDAGELYINTLEYESSEESIIDAPIIDEPVSEEPIIDEPSVEEPAPIIDVGTTEELECSVDIDCGENFSCVRNYCVSKTGQLNITDRNGTLVALFDKFGRVLLAGQPIQQSVAVPPPNAFIIEGDGAPVAWITAEGDFHMTGILEEGAASIEPEGSKNFLLKNENEFVCMVEGTTGNVYTIKDVIAGALFTIERMSRDIILGNTTTIIGLGGELVMIDGNTVLQLT